MNMTLLKRVKESEQDFEWYPTTREIMTAVCQDLSQMNEKNYSMLDIGAGDGNVFRLIDEISPNTLSSRYAIEKSEVLINAMDKDVFIVGTDFHEQTLIDKAVDVVFCNPPYSEYEQWVEKIILEARCTVAYLVIPDRWVDNRAIKEALKRRKVSAKSIGEYTFEHSEYRQARAKVELLKIRFKYCRGESGRDACDPFDVWFESTFTFDADRHDTSEYERNRAEEKRVHEIAKGDDVVRVLSECYIADLAKLHENYRAVERLDYDILEELNVNVNGLKKSLHQKIKGTKSRYWNELFDRFEPITSRLTSSSRRKLLERLTSETSIDFTTKNAYSVIIWAVKNANYYYDEQLLEMYLSMASEENITGYKSNKRFETDEWRYLSEWDRKRVFRDGKVERYALDYRLVFDRWGSNFNGDKYGFGSYDYPNGLRKESHEFINDIFTIAKNLGFEVMRNTYEVGEWLPGKTKEFQYRIKGKVSDKWEPFAEIKAYKNGNIHGKFCPAFMCALNVEAGRLNGWLRDPAHANDELGIKDAEKYFQRNIQLLPSNTQLLLSNKGSERC